MSRDLNIAIKFRGDSRHLRGAVDEAVAQTDRLGDVMRRVGHYGAGLFAGNFAAGWVRQVAQAADAFTTLDNRLRLSAGSTAAAALAYGELFAVAQRARVSVTELGATYAQIARNTDSLGLTQQELVGVTETIAKAMQISGGSAQSMQAAMVQLGQGLASGALRGEELNSIMEQTPRLARLIADGLGIGIGELRRWGEEGRLTAEAVVGALRHGATQIDAEFARVRPTIGGAFETLSNALGDAVHRLDEAGHVTPRVADAITALADSISGAVDSAEKADSLFRLLELLLAVGAGRGAAALLGRVGGMAAGAAAGAAGGAVLGPFGAAGGAVAGAAIGAGVWALTTDTTAYGRGMRLGRAKSLGDVLEITGQMPEAPEWGADDPVAALEDALGIGAGVRRYLFDPKTGSKRETALARQRVLLEEFSKAVPAFDPANAMHMDAYGLLLERLADAAPEKRKPAPRKAETAAARKARWDLWDGDGRSAAEVMRQLHDQDRAEETSARVRAVMAESTAGLESRYQRSNEAANEATLPAADRALAAALREVAEQAQAARKSIADRAAALKDDAGVQAAMREELDKVTAAERAQADAVVALWEKQQALNGSWEHGASQALRNYADQVANVAQTTEQVFTRAFSGMEDALVAFVKTGKLDFKALADSIITDLIRIQVRQSITGPLAGALGEMFKGFKFAEGGIMSAAGPLPLRRYSSGGIASSPQLAMFGEGSVPEAYVPVPSGKIPVELKGGGAGVQVSFNLINRTGVPQAARQQGPARQSGDRYIVDVVLDAMENDPRLRAAMG